MTPREVSLIFAHPPGNAFSLANATTITTRCSRWLVLLTLTFNTKHHAQPLTPTPILKEVPMNIHQNNSEIRLSHIFLLQLKKDSI
jgi:hypothetical protein